MPCWRSVRSVSNHACHVYCFPQQRDEESLLVVCNELRQQVSSALTTSSNDSLHSNSKLILYWEHASVRIRGRVSCYWLVSQGGLWVEQETQCLCWIMARQACVQWPFTDLGSRHASRLHFEVWRLMHKTHLTLITTSNIILVSCLRTYNMLIKTHCNLRFITIRMYAQGKTNCSHHLNSESWLEVQSIPLFCL